MAQNLNILPTQLNVAPAQPIAPTPQPQPTIVNYVPDALLNNPQPIAAASLDPAPPTATKVGQPQPSSFPYVPDPLLNNSAPSSSVAIDAPATPPATSTGQPQPSTVSYVPDASVNNTLPVSTVLPTGVPPAAGPVLTS